MDEQRLRFIMESCPANLVGTTVVLRNPDEVVAVTVLAVRNIHTIPYLETSIGKAWIPVMNGPPEPVRWVVESVERQLLENAT